MSVTMKTNRSISKSPVCFLLILSLVVMLLSGFMIFMCIRIANDVKEYGSELEKHGRLHRDMVLSAVVIAIDICATIGYALGFTYLALRAVRREISLHAELIKQKEATQKAEKESSNKSSKFASVSHELRNVVTGITGFVRVSRGEDVPRSTLDENLRHIESGTQELNSLLSSILDVSKIEAGKMQVEAVEFDLLELLEDTVDFHHPLGMEKGIDIILDLCDGSVEKYRNVRGDREKLRVILYNLLNNAIKFTEEGYISLRVLATKPNSNNNRDINLGASQNVRVGASFISTLRRIFFGEKEGNDNGVGGESEGVEKDDDDIMEYVFEVVDSGVGVAKEKRKSVFEKYVQVKDTDNSGHHQSLGHGLGLGIVKSYVNLMGGEIEIVDKENGEKGTCFRFNTFLENLGQDIESQSAYASDNQSHSGRRSPSHVVLFIQSKERSRVVKKFLESHGIGVTVVTKGCKQLSKTLKKIKRNVFGHSNTGGTSTPTYYSSSSSSPDHTIPLRTNPEGSVNNKYVVLIIVDTVGGPLQEVSRAITEFCRDLHTGCAKVVWTDRLGAHSEESRGNLHLPSTDLVMSKPLQGSRLHNILGLLSDSPSTSQPSTTEIEVVIDKQGKETEKIKQDEAGSSTNTSAAKKKPLEGLRILIVEDSKLLSTLSKRMVSQLGAQTETCSNGEEAFIVMFKALSDPDQPSFDYILMDCEMPIMDGFEATRHIKKEASAMGKSIPIIALTAHTEEEQIDKITKAGMDYYLSKPLKVDELLKAIQSLGKSQIE